MTKTQENSETGVPTAEELEEIDPRLKDDALKVIENDFESDYSPHEDGEIKIGPEDEFFIFNSNGPLGRERRNEIVRKLETEEDGPIIIRGTDRYLVDLNSIYPDSELGSSMFELSPASPRTISSLGEYDRLMRKIRAPVLDELNENEYLVLSSILPVDSMRDIELSRHDTGRFSSLIESYAERQQNIPESLGRAGYEVIDPENVKTPGGITSHQLNLQPPSAEEGIEWANLIYAWQPFVLSIAGNSRVVEAKDTGLAEPGKFMWPMNFNSDGYEDVGKWGSFLDSVEDDLSRQRAVTEFEVDEDASELAVAKKQDWKYVKPKYDVENGQMVVEWRAIPQQPTVEENVAAGGMMLGLLGYSLLGDGPGVDDFDIEDVNFNYDAAMLYGKDQELITPEGERKKPEEIIPGYIEKAGKGLELWGLEENGYLKLMEYRLEDPGENPYAGTPSERTAREFNDLREENSPMDAYLEAVPKKRSENG